MGFYRFADRVFELKNKYAYTAKLCASYSVKADRADYVIEVSEDEIMAEGKDNATSFPPAYLESLAIYRKISSVLAEDDCFLIHSAVIEYEGTAYAFTAKSGTGKSTHINLWEKAFGDKVRIINGDKPLVRRKTDHGKSEFIIYGTPWCGKEHKNINTYAKLGGICLLERSEINFIERAGDEAIPFLMGQMIINKDGRYLAGLMSFIGDLLSSVPVYKLGVNTDISAATVARDGLLKGT